MGPKRAAKAEPLAKRAKYVMPLEDKIKVLDCLQKGLSNCAVGRLFGVNESTIRSIKKNEDAIRVSVANGTSASIKITKLARDPIIEKMEKALSIWLEDQNQRKIPLNTAMICSKAKRIYRHLVQSSGRGDAENFMASKGWFENFKKRYGLQSVKVIGESPSAEEVQSFVTAARHLGSNGFADLESSEVAHLLESRAGELTEEELEELIASNTEPQQQQQQKKCKDSKEKTALTLAKLNQFLQHASELADEALEMDPFVERSLKFRRKLREGLSPYKKLQKDLRRRVLQPTLHAYFKAADVEQPGPSGSSSQQASGEEAPGLPEIVTVTVTSLKEEEEEKGQDDLSSP